MRPSAPLLRDWSRSFALHGLWVNLALEDLRDRYRRTVLGLSWIVVSFAVAGGYTGLRATYLWWHRHH